MTPPDQPKPEPSDPALNGDMSLQEIARELGIIPESPGPRRVLVVDDNPVVLRVLQKTLDTAGFRTATALSGVAALQKVKEQRPDLILLDIMMPVMTGWDVLNHLRTLPGCKDIPVIMVSAKNQKADVVKSFQLGAIDYVLKPFKGHLLVQKVAKILGVTVPESALEPPGEDRTTRPAVFEVFPEGNVTILRLRSDLDATTLEPAVRQVDATASKGETRLVFDPSPVDLTSVHGIEAFKQLVEYAVGKGHLVRMVIKDPILSQALKKRNVSAPIHRYLSEALDAFAG